MIISNMSDIGLIENGNKILGENPDLINSKIVFNGNNNILFCENGVNLYNSTISFNGNNSVVYLSENKHNYYINISTHNDSIFHMGKNNYINNTLTIILSERKHCFIGDDGIFSTGIVIRNADPHLVYECTTGKRKNMTKSVYIGDHVWIGQDSLILKGTQIDSGSIIGGMSVVANKKIPNNESWGGNPVKCIANNIFWDEACVHLWDKKKTKASILYSNLVDNYYTGKEKDKWIYKFSNNESLSFNKIDKLFDAAKNSEHKLEALLDLNINKSKNRFVRSISYAPVPKYKRILKRLKKLLRKFL